MKKLIIIAVAAIMATSFTGCCLPSGDCDDCIDCVPTGK